MDEFSEIILLMKEGKMPKMPVFLIGKSFWRPLDRYYRSKLLPMGLIDREDVKVYKLTDDLMDVVRAANKIGHLVVGENLYEGYSQEM